MNIKIITHIMPWEIDYAHLLFTQLKKSKYYIPEDVNITIDTVLNLSSYTINWEESKLPKEYFIKKYDTISLLLKDYNHIKRVYEGNELYGHLDSQRECVSPEIDFYIGTCPDIYFTEHLIYYMIESLRNINDKYFILTPQHRKLSDHTWDPTTDPDYLSVPYDRYNEVDLYDIRYKLKTNPSEISLEETTNGKFAGWMDVYSKGFYEHLVPLHDDWHGYGPWDFYSYIIISFLKSKNIDCKHYVLRGQTVGEHWIGPLLENDGFSGYYKEFIVKNIVPNQREIFESNLKNYISRGIEMLQEKNII